MRSCSSLERRPDNGPCAQSFGEAAIRRAGWLAGRKSHQSLAPKPESNGRCQGRTYSRRTHHRDAAPLRSHAAAGSDASGAGCLERASCTALLGGADCRRGPTHANQTPWTGRSGWRHRQRPRGVRGGLSPLFERPPPRARSRSSVRQIFLPTKGFSKGKPFLLARGSSACPTPDGASLIACIRGHVRARFCREHVQSACGKLDLPGRLASRSERRSGDGESYVLCGSVSARAERHARRRWNPTALSGFVPIHVDCRSIDPPTPTGDGGAHRGALGFL